MPGPSVGGTERLLCLRLGDHLIQRTFGAGEVAALQSAVALLRTIFEDHYVDPDHHSFLFFHGCTIAGRGRRVEDFTVVHRHGRVMLSEFTSQRLGPAIVSLPLSAYASDVLHFAESVLAAPVASRQFPDWQRRYVQGQWKSLVALTALTRRFLRGGCTDYETYCAEFANVHGHLKRPLELLVVAVLGKSVPFNPVSVAVRVRFGPIRAGEVLPMRLNRGDLLRATVTEFTTAGVVLLLEGAGSGGVCPGDQLFGTQLLYP
ncbi:MAG: hypothetical protein JWN15_3728 [Firmicutes bacterium]|nr:hypothetical protein [Bacillota bacterium]